MKYNKEDLEKLDTLSVHLGIECSLKEKYVCHDLVSKLIDDMYEIRNKYRVDIT